MADHYRAAVEHLDEAEALSEELVTAYRANAARGTVGHLHHQYGHALKSADIHAQLAVVQALHDQELVR